MVTQTEGAEMAYAQEVTAVCFPLISAEGSDTAAEVCAPNRPDWMDGCDPPQES